MGRSNILLEKSIAACISSIEIYNKPDFKYREETFCILIINAWELLLKAKILKDHNNRIDSIYVKEPKQLKNGSKSNKQFIVKRNRLGNPMTIELLRALDIISKSPSNNITIAFKENITALCEIRDCAIHYKNTDLDLNKLVLELGTASLKNYLHAIKYWFDKDMSKYNFFLMPISFYHDFEFAVSQSVSSRSNELNNLLKYINKKSREITSDPAQDYNLILKLETQLVKAKGEEKLQVKEIKSYKDSKNPENVQEIILTEDRIMERFPWSFAILCEKLKERYSDFKQGNKIHTDLMKTLKANTNLTHTRLHNPKSLKSSATYFYSPNCLANFFDSKYARKK